MQEKDRDLTKLLWFKDITKPVTTGKIVVHRFTGIPFGVLSSQFILAANIIDHLMEKRMAVSEKIERDIYVDNLITGKNTKRSAMKIYLKGKEISRNVNESQRMGI